MFNTILNFFEKIDIKYYLASFVAGFGMMTLELTASRVVAPMVGSSVYTWTSVIGVVLLGSILGNYLGGYLIDKYQSKKIIFIFCFLISIFVLFIPILSQNLLIIISSQFSVVSIIIFICLILFFLPSLFIGTIYPCLLKLKSKETNNLGITSGSLSAFWSLGSIIGTVLTGFVFIGFWGSFKTLLGVAIIFFLLGLFFLEKLKPMILFFFIFVIFFVFSLFFLNSNKYLVNKETNYYALKVVDSEASFLGRVRTLFLDFDSHSIESLENKPLHIYPESVPIFKELKNDTKDILVIGGGAYTIAKNFSDLFLDSNVEVLEIDPEVKKVAEEYFNLKKYPIKTIISDGRFYLTNSKNNYDLIFEDAFNSFISLPWHLTTQEFNQLAKEHLNKDGVYAVNFISAFEGENSLFFQSMLKTFSQTFPNYYILSFGNFGFESQNIILVGINGDKKISEDQLKNILEKNQDGIWLSSLVIKDKIIPIDKSVVFKDDFAPTERMMVPLVDWYFRSYVNFYYSLF